jgi:hypothetical protein
MNSKNHKILGAYIYHKINKINDLDLKIEF